MVSTPIPARAKVSAAGEGKPTQPESFIEAGRKQQKEGHGFIGAKPKVVQQRPGTAAPGT